MGSPSATSCQLRRCPKVRSFPCARRNLLIAVASLVLRGLPAWLWAIRTTVGKLAFDPYRYQLKKELVPAVEGLHTGQFVYCGKKAQLSIGNVLPVAKMPEGTVVSMCEEKSSDRGRINLS